MYYWPMISKEEVLRLAELARLEVTDEQVVELQTNISNILDYIKQVEAVSVEGSHTEKPLMRNVVREDALYDAGTPTVGKEEALRAAFPKEERGYNVVRKIIQKDE